jgi:hypothetical protein
MRLQELHEAVVKPGPVLDTKLLITKWLRRASITEFVIHDDLSVSVFDVILSERQMKGYTELPIKFRKVNGNFEIRKVPLTSLKGFPDTVAGYVHVMESAITSLEGAPHSIGHGFSISDAPNLVSLKGFPTEIGTSIALENCTALKTLEGFPSAVNGSVSLDGCRALTSLKGLPRILPEDLSINDCSSLTSLEGAPEYISKWIQIHDASNLRNLRHLPNFSDGKGVLYFGGNDTRLVKDMHSIFMSKGLVNYVSTAITSEDIQVRKIVSKYLPLPFSMKRWIDCQSELIDAGYEDYAEVSE